MKANHLAYLFATSVLATACGDEPVVNRRSVQSVTLGDIKDDGGNGGTGATKDACGVVGDVTFAKHVLPTIQDQCVACHNNKVKSGNLALDQLTPDEKPESRSALWAKVLDRVTRDDGMRMPPAAPLSDCDTKNLKAWLGVKDDVSCSAPLPPARTTLRRLNRSEYRHSVKDLLGLKTDVSDDLPSDARSPDGFSNNASILTTSADAMAVYLKSAQTLVGQALSSSGAPYATCLSANPTAKSLPACAKQHLTALASRAYRRPATAAEVKSLGSLASSIIAAGGSLTDGLSGAMQAVLISPNFLYMPEGDGRAHKLSGHQFVTRLAFFIWNGLPDKILGDAAASGKIFDQATLRAQIKRMLADGRSKRFTENFASDWLDTSDILSTATVSRDPGKFPGFSAALRASMKMEVDAFFHHAVTANRPLTELLTAEYTYADTLLTSHYQLDGAKGDTPSRISLAGSSRRGITSHGAFLTINSGIDRTSPTARGHWILDKLLCKPPPPLPDDLVVPELPAGTDSLSLREKLKVHRSTPECQGCHAAMDPIGLAFENFDQIGRYRTKDNANQPVDPSGELLGAGKFKGHIDLIDVLVGTGDFQTCLTKKMFAYAVGRAAQDADQCLVKEIAADMQKSGATFQDLIVRIVSSDAFQSQGAE